MLEETLSFALIRLIKAHRNLLAGELAKLDLHVGQEMLLNQLWQEDGVSQAVLIERLGVEPPTVTRTLQRLERAGLVHRQAEPGPRRVLRVYLTERGRALRGPVEAVWRKAEERLLAALSEEERAQLRTVVGKMSASLAPYRPRQSKAAEISCG
ncbi:MarR family winged helix-turn-helix transcriptional regulator [Thermostaphylospora chromogena]|uniref:DNA-binding transcriptional regulator, MarR family n=1 Tax=Thermostaphylospora chromogena TaxID=35622 RepID=A0A1H1BSJ6_9ACTN|nr:MarR family transcriptional regulator [Thermostaphylospora chromogena]SDQ54918.1 DNA-binding transcriptional regulator, MarR family [Thermostaphylospora chromogena]